MERFTEKQRVFEVEHYFGTNDGMVAIVCNFYAKCGGNSHLSSLPVWRLFKKFMECWSNNNLRNSGRTSTSLSLENVEANHERVAESPGKSNRHHGQELDILRNSLSLFSRKFNWLKIWRLWACSAKNFFESNQFQLQVSLSPWYFL